jgi:hypothetical protein
MKSFHRYAVVLLLATGSVVAYAQSSLSGKWRGMEGSLPFIELTVEQNTGHATGSALFYLIKDNRDGNGPHVDGQAAGPMENLNYEPEKMTFDMHRSDGSRVSFRVELIDTEHARLFRTSDSTAEGSGFPLLRVKP